MLLKMHIFLVFSRYRFFVFFLRRKIKNFSEKFAFFPLFWVFYLPKKRYLNANFDMTLRKVAFPFYIVPRP